MRISFLSSALPLVWNTKPAPYEPRISYRECWLLYTVQILMLLWLGDGTLAPCRYRKIWSIRYRISNVDFDASPAQTRVQRAESRDRSDVMVAITTPRSRSAAGGIAELWQTSKQTTNKLPRTITFGRLTWLYVQLRLTDDWCLLGLTSYRKTWLSISSLQLAQDQSFFITPYEAAQK